MNHARKQLSVCWDQTARRWNDPNRRRLEKEYVHLWDKDARRAARAMTELSVIVAKMRQDCS